MDFMILRELAELFNNDGEFRGAAKACEPMAERTTMRVGGTAPLLVEPADEGSLARAVRVLRGRGEPFFVLGGGSNVVMADEPEFAVLSTRRLNSVSVSRSGGAAEIRAGAGATWGRVGAACRRENLSAFENFSALPGTVGGALVMNASCFGLSACDRLLRARFLDVRTGELSEYGPRAEDWGYKRSPFQGGGKIVVSAAFRAEPFAGSAEELSRLYARTARERAAKGHFSAPSAGSFFRNDPERGVVAGMLIDGCGLKGTRVGGAKVSEFHGNFIVNAGGATAADVRSLAEAVRRAVLEGTGVELVPEVVFA